MELFRYATDVYGQTVLLGASWDLFWWFIAAGCAYVAIDIICRLRQRAKPLAGDGRSGAKMTRHDLLDRLYHWVMAASVLTLLFTAFAPILGWKFEWVTTHWIAGLVLALIVVIHILRATIWQDFWAMMVVPADLRDAWQEGLHVLGHGPEPALPGKYDLLQKLYHWAIAGLVLALIVTGLLMLAKIDTPFWQRNPYFLSDASWGVIYVVHDLCAMAVIALVLIHIYLGLRPDRFWVLRSMIGGSITRQEYLTYHDPKRWVSSDRDA
jgi:formate dehydrogenase subunit gamma